jgi:hypothetical protein
MLMSQLHVPASAWWTDYGRHLQTCRGEHPPRPHTGLLCVGISHQGTGVDETCNQEHLKKMVVPLLCKCFEQRNKRHIVKYFGVG